MTDRIKTLLSKEPAFTDTLKVVNELVQTPNCESYRASADWALRLQMEVQRAIAKLLAPLLNDQLRELPQQTYEQKKELCRWVNAELRNLGLAVLCPKTGLPAMMHAAPGNHPELGRFEIQLSGSTSQRKRTRFFPELIPIQLCNATERQEPLVNYWTNQVSKPTPEGKRQK